MLVSYVPMPCVSRCRLNFIHVGNSMPTCSVSNQMKPDPLRTWLWLSSRTRDRNVILRAFTKPEPSERLTALALMGLQSRQNNFWSFGLLLSLLRMSGRATLSYRWRHCEGTKEKRNGRITSILLARKHYSILEMWECQWKLHMRENHEITSFVRSTFPYKRPLSFENLFYLIRKGELFGNV